MTLPVFYIANLRNEVRQHYEVGDGGFPGWFTFYNLPSLKGSLSMYKDMEKQTASR